MPRTNIEPYMVVGGQRLRGRRTDLGLTMEEIAKAIGRSVSTVSKYERGQSNPMQHAISRKYAAVLKLASLASLYVEGRVERAGGESW